MGSIVKFKDNVLNKEERMKYRFINRNVNVMDEDGKRDAYPCIVMYEIESKIPVAYTGYERYLISLVYSERLSGSTLAKRAVEVCKFLNYLLYETDISRIEDCTLDDIRSFLIFSKTKADGTTYQRETWIRMKTYVLSFLRNYYLAYKDIISFQYNGEELQKYIIVRDREKRGKVILADNAGLNVKAPKATAKKNRVLVYGYLELLLYEAKKYDVELALAIGLQAYAGLREGEVVNLTVGSICPIRKQFGQLTGITINLETTSSVFEKWTKKTDPGSIKRFRTQRVYDDFLEDILKLYNYHILWLESHGYDTSSDAPLFLNLQGNIMTVSTYTGRVKQLFYQHFLPMLKYTCEKENTLLENAPFIEAYENQYPGAHAFRHWFTMYLITKTNLKTGEIVRWRGDKNEKSMEDYIHEYGEVIEIYRDSTYRLQEQLLQDIEWY